jgi:hypothetical protein
MNLNRARLVRTRTLVLLASAIGLCGCVGPTQFTAAISDPGTTAYDARLIGTWIGLSQNGRSLVISVLPQKEQGLRIVYAEMFERGLALSGYASKVNGETYYNVKPETASYFRAFEKAKELPHHLLFRVEVVNDDEVYVWTSSLDGETRLAGLKARMVDDYYLFDVPRDALVAALKDMPLGVLNIRFGPFFRVAPREPMRNMSWALDQNSGCAIGLAGQGSLPKLAWSGDCRDGKASGRGVLEFLKEGKVSSKIDVTMAEGVPHGSSRCSEDGSDNWKPCRFEHGDLVKDKN